MPQGFRLGRLLLFQSKPAFEPHLGEKALLRGLAERKVFSGEIIVSHHNNSKSKLMTESKERINCNGFVHRNRALSGDHVYAMLTESTDESSQSTSSEDEESSDSLKGVLNAIETMGESLRSCKVVAIKKRSGQRYVARTRSQDPIVQPRDTRFPAMGLKSALEKQSLCLVSLKDWEETEQYPTCELIRVLGPEGCFDAEDDASLEMKGLLSDKYSKNIEGQLRGRFPSAGKVVSSQLSVRKDCRSERVFSIDPATAKDLDDAISLQTLPGNKYRIGVHVADVSHFVGIGSAVDSEAKLRATSVYLPRKVYPMLPAYLSENMCSLLPNADRLAFSVYFTLDEEAQFVASSTEIVRTIIRSRAKLSYDEVDGKKTSSKIPSEILKDIEVLLRLTAKLRKQRIANGSVSIDDRNCQELKFEFADLVSGGTFPFQLVAEINAKNAVMHDSHTLIEELMVLTNRIVAETLCGHSQSTIPVVRRHMDSEESVKKAALEFLKDAGIKIKGNKALSDILLCAKTKLSPALFSAFNHSILGEFNRAEYVVAASDTSETPSSAVKSLAHWGVGAQRYMHFTSPIRRYADLIVHRKLVKILNLGGSDVPEESDEEIALQIKQCNIKSRAAQEAENDNKLFYFTTLVKSFGNQGYPVQAIIKELIAPNEAKNVKGSVALFLPVLGEERSQSLDSLGLSVADVRLAQDKKVTCMRVVDKKGESFELKLLASFPVRAYVKGNSSLLKFHLRPENSVPPPPPRR